MTHEGKRFSINFHIVAIRESPEAHVTVIPYYNTQGSNILLPRLPTTPCFQSKLHPTRATNLNRKSVSVNPSPRSPESLHRLFGVKKWQTLTGQEDGVLHPPTAIKIIKICDGVTEADCMWQLCYSMGSLTRLCRYDHLSSLQEAACIKIKPMNTKTLQPWGSTQENSNFPGKNKSSARTEFVQAIVI